VNRVLGDIPRLIRRPLATIFRSGAATSMHGQGLGRHSEADINRFLRRDLQALAATLGGQTYINGAPGRDSSGNPGSKLNGGTVSASVGAWPIIRVKPSGPLIEGLVRAAQSATTRWSTWTVSLWFAHHSAGDRPCDAGCSLFGFLEAAAHADRPTVIKVRVPLCCALLCGPCRVLPCCTGSRDGLCVHPDSDSPRVGAWAVNDGGPCRPNTMASSWACRSA